VGLCSLTFIVLLVIKLCGVAVISWWWVFFPLLIVAGFWLVLMPMGVIACILWNCVRRKRDG
jgi:hypothetical protein